MACMEYWEAKQKARLLSIVSGLLFSIGWWVFIDAVQYHNKVTAATEDPSIESDEQPIIFGFWMPGICTTLSFFMINSMDFGALNADEMTYHGGAGTALKARAFLIFSLLVALGCLTGATYVLVDTYADGNAVTKDKVVTSSYPGVAIFLQTFLIFISTWVMRLGTMTS